MILPASLLRTVAFYETTTSQTMCEGHNTKVVLHYKSFWKFRKVIKIRWTLGQDDMWREPLASLQLRTQLAEYFRTQ